VESDRDLWWLGSDDFEPTVLQSFFNYVGVLLPKSLSFINNLDLDFLWNEDLSEDSFEQIQSACFGKVDQRCRVGDDGGI